MSLLTVSELVGAQVIGDLYSSSRKANRSSEAVRMLERCINLEPLFTAAYLELVKLYSGLKAGQLLRRVVQLNPYDVDLRRQYGDWLVEQNLLPEAIVQYQEGLKIMETHQLSVIGACRALRRLGQHSRLHQLILRWQFIVRLSNGGIPIQTEIYLRDWSLKHELRNRAMIYDAGSDVGGNGATGGDVGSSTTGPSSASTRSMSQGSRQSSGSGLTSSVVAEESSVDCSSSYDGCLSSTDATLHSHTKLSTTSVDSEISIRILRAPHCNRSEHVPGSLKNCKVPSGTPPSSQRPSSSSRVKSSSSQEDEKTAGKHKKWPKSRHKSKRHPPTATGASSELEPSSGGLTPLLVSNLLDKL